jgi:magnesium-transporting ATPase (P-type)
MVYLTRFKSDGYKAYIHHTIYSIIIYFNDPINIFCLLVSFGQIYEYNDLRSFYPLIIFCSISTINHLYSISSLLTTQNKLNSNYVDKLDIKKDKYKTIKQKNLRRGDIITLTEHSTIPADILLINCNISVQELELTGEDIVISKSGINLQISNLIKSELVINHWINEGCIKPLDTKLLNYDSKNMLFCGTKIIDIQNNTNIYGVVIETGNDCQIYRINNNYTKNKTSIQKELLNICLKNLYIMMLISSFFGVILYAKSATYSYRKLWSHIRKMILLLNTVVPLSLQFFFNTASMILSSRISTKHNVKINRNGTVSFQTNPTFIVSDKTGTITTNQMELVTILTNKPSTDIDLLTNVISCSEIQVHSKKGHLLKNDIIEEKLLKHLLTKLDGKLIKNSVFDGPVQIELHDKSIKFNKLYYQPFNYKLEVKLGVIEIGDNIFLNIQGTPESILKYSNNKLSTLLQEVDNMTHPQDAYKRIIAHGIKKISLEDLAVLKQNPEIILKDFHHISLYVFYDYIVSGVSTSVKNLLDNNKDFTLLTGDRMISAYEIGLTLGICNNCITIDTEEDLTKDINQNICVLINGKLFEKIVNSNKCDKLVNIIRATNKKIIYRATPYGKQLYISFIQTKFDKEVMMVGDGSNDVSALIQSNISIGIKQDNNMNVQNVSDIVLDKWTTIPDLLDDFKLKQKMVENINNLVLMKHMLTASVLITMLLLSNFEKVKDPASPYLMSIFNSTIFVSMYIYCKFEDIHNISITYKSILKGIVIGIIDGLLIFPLVEVNNGIKILVSIQVCQLLIELYKISHKLLVKTLYFILANLWILYTIYITYVISSLYICFLFGIIFVLLTKISFYL